MSECAQARQVVRVEWRETRSGEAVLVSAERNPAGGWIFFERSVWEVRWYPVPGSPGLLATADQMAQARAQRASA